MTFGCASSQNLHAQSIGYAHAMIAVGLSHTFQQHYHMEHGKPEDVVELSSSVAVHARTLSVSCYVAARACSKGPRAG